MVTKRKNMFQRTKYRAYVKLGSGQKSKLKYKRAKGRHNKTRQKWRSRPPMVEVGYKNPVAQRNLINNKIQVLVFNVQDLAKVGKDSIAIIAKVGNKNKIMMAKEIQKRKIEVLNLNVNKFLKNVERKEKIKQEQKTKSKTEIKVEEKK